MEPLSEALTEFMSRNVESIDQLEILRVLGTDHEKGWDPAALADAIDAAPQAVRAHLAALSARGLLIASAKGARLLYRYGAATPETGELLARLLRTYNERPVTVIRKIYEQVRNPPGGVNGTSRGRETG